MKNLEEGVQTTLYCALSPDLEGVTGKYYMECKEDSPSKTLLNRKWQTVLWEESSKIVKLTDEDPQI
jgi:hypothetical protein